MSKVADANHIDEKHPLPIDPKVINGPVEDRSCTDIICLVLIIISFIIMWWIAITGFAQGTPERLLAAYDPDGKACGLDYSDYPYIYFPILYTDYYNYTVCVKECPQNSSSKVECQTNQLIKSCNENCGSFNLDTAQSLLNYPGSVDLSKFFCIYSSETFLDRVCVPTKALEYLNQSSEFSAQVDINKLSGWMNDLITAWAMILISFFIAFLIGLAYMMFVRYFSGIVIWAAIIAYFICLAILAAYCKNQSVQYYNNSQIETNADQSSNLADTAKTLEYLSYVLFGLWALSLFGLFCMYHKIRLAIAVIKTAAIFVRDNFLILYVPIVFSVILGLFWLWWIASAVYVVSLGSITGDGTSPFAKVTWSTYQRNMIWYFIFGGLWKNAFIQAIVIFIIASTCSIWYFNQQSGQFLNINITKAIYRTFRYHLGSLAFGSLILALVQVIRIILEYVRYQFKQMKADENKFLKCLLDCLRCYMEYFERFIRFLTRQAYIQIAITGKNFCVSAKEAFETVFANTMRFALVGGIGSIFNLIGKLLISILTVMISYLFLTGLDYYVTQLTSPILPCVIIFIIAFTVGILFMSIYGMACDCVLMCYIYDEELNKQSGGGSAQHCPETLREFFETNQ